jgi:hypothetical protein
MFVKGEKIFADKGCYLKHKQLPIIGLTIKGNPDDYEEIRISEPLDVVVDGNKVLIYNRKFAILPDSMSYSDIKKKVIKSRYSLDDQLAIILNKDSSEEDAIYFQKMQEWREFASEVARLATNPIIE